MVYVDTNILVYITADQGEDKRDMASKLVRKLIANGEFFLSPLTIQELIFTLSKLGIRSDQVSGDINYYMDYIQEKIDKDILREAYTFCKEIGACKNINDVIHLKVAEKCCRKLVTFDTDFKKFQDRTNIEIEIL